MLYGAIIGAVAVTGHSCDHVSSRRKSGHSDSKCHNVSKKTYYISYFHKNNKQIDQNVKAKRSHYFEQKSKEKTKCGIKYWLSDIYAHFIAPRAQKVTWSHL